MQDFTGVPAVADLAAMRNALKSIGIEPKKINPLSRVDLVIDHSVMVDRYKDNAVCDKLNILGHVRSIRAGGRGHRPRRGRRPLG
mgnify:CR=1 FL=1